MKVRFFVSNGMNGGRREEIIDIPDDEVEGMDEGELDEHLRGYALDFMNMREQTILAAYAWRAADVHHAACVGGIRTDNPDDACIKLDVALSNLRIMIDALHREEKSLGLLR